MNKQDELHTQEAAALRRKLKIRETELALLEGIARAMGDKWEMQAIYDLVGQELSQLFDGQSILIAAYDPETGLGSFPYMLEDGQRLYPTARPMKEIVLGSKLMVDPTPIKLDTIEQFAELGLKTIDDSRPSLSGLFVPMVSGDRVYGGFSVQSQDEEYAFADADLNLLVTIANSISQALENARLFEETQKRNAELAVINSVQQGLVAQMEMPAIYKLVGDKVREIFDAQVVMIGIYDHESRTATVPYSFEKGLRFDISKEYPFNKLSDHLISSRETVLINDNLRDFVENYELFVIAGEAPQSLLFVPLVVGKQVKGFISLQNIDRENAFSPPAVRLLETLAASMSVALENARLFDQTQRLLEDSRQRNAELALLNSVQQGLVAELDMQAIYDLVGDKVREIFHAQVVLIAVYDLQEKMTSVPYLYEKGERLFLSDSKSSGLCIYFQENPHTLVINENIEEAFEKYYLRVHIGEAPKSLVFVPLIVGKEVTGHISLQCIDRENAFSDSDVRLLETLAASMSVALENARLFEESQQRNAELAVINSVQQGLVAQIHMDAIYELVGDQIREIFDAQVVTINRFDFERQLNDYCYVYEKGQLFSVEPQPFTPILEEFIAEGRPLLLNASAGELLREGGGRVVAGKMPKSFVAIPLWSDNKVTGSISLQNVERENAFTNDHVRLLGTVAASTSVALENARYFAMVKRRAKEMAALAEVGLEISSTLDLPTVLERIARHARDLLNVKDSAVFLPDESGTFMKGYVALGPIAAEVKASIVKPGIGILGHIWQNGEAEVINEAHKDPRAILIGGTEQQVDEKMMVTPLYSGARITGLMAVWRTGGDNFKDADLDFFVGLSRQAAIAIENARLYSEAETARAAAEEANRSKSAFLANVSHELRTPLTSILGFAHVLQNRLERRIQPVIPTDDQQVQHALAQIDESLSIILSEGERLTTLINNVLDLEKIEAGKMEWDMKPLDLAQVLEQGIDATSLIIEQKGLTLKREIADELPRINGDHDKLVQVIINLLSNAIKFTTEGGITCSAQAQEGVLKVSISDTGEGIAKRDLESVFEKFQQVGDTLTEKPRGTGLGLPICKEIVERHGGRIWAESMPGEGSTFSFILPIESTTISSDVGHISMDELLTKLKQQIAVVPSASSNGRRTVLVADDDEAIRKLLVQELSGEGYKVYQAADGREALEQVKTHQLDLVILDVLMPELTGFDVAAVIKHDPQTMGLPIVIISVLEDKERGFRLGVDRYLTKPIKIPKLLAEVENLLAQGGSRRRILVIDEDTTTVEKLSAALQSGGFEVTAVTGGDEGIRAAIEAHPDMIIVNAALSEEHQMVQTIRFEKGLENVFFLLFQK